MAKQPTESVYTKNLLRNTHAENLDYWTPEDSGTVSVEDRPGGARPLLDFVPPDEMQGKPAKNWVTSHQFASISQKVKLLEEGCSEYLLDELRPSIYISVWHGGRSDCGSRFELTVRLMDGCDKEVNSLKREIRLEDPNVSQMWHKVEHTLSGYGPGVRTVVFTMGGVDLKNWAGNYGAKFTLPCLRFQPLTEK